jgi:Na+-translocating ferredoxin:NAD+ oxidoreductase RnfG subunit
MKKIFLLNIICMTFIFSSEIKNKSIETIKSFYNYDIKIDSKKFSISQKTKRIIQNKIKQKFYQDQIHYWIIEVDGKYHYALLDNTLGKTMPITFLVLFDENQEVIHSSIIKYREGYGGEISGKNWLNQFLGMRNDSLLKFGKDIDGITGATISVKSFTKGISKLSLLLPYIMANNKK